MKRLFMLIVCSFITVSLFAQYAETSIPVLKGSRVFVDGEKIPHSDVLAYLTSGYDDSVADNWNRYRNAYKTGLGLTIAGASVTGCSMVLCAGGFVAGAGVVVTSSLFALLGVYVGDMQPAVDYFDSGISAAGQMMLVGVCGTLAGVAMLASGIPTLCVYKKRLNTMFDEYGPGLKSDVNLTFGPTDNGVGFALRF